MKFSERIENEALKTEKLNQTGYKTGTPETRRRHPDTSRDGVILRVMRIRLHQRTRPSFQACSSLS